MKFIVTTEAKTHWHNFFKAAKANAHLLWESIGVSEMVEKNVVLTEFMTTTEAGLLQFTKNELDQGKDDFKNHYTESKNNPGFYDPIEVSWTAFSNNVTAGVGDPGRMALRFIHRYNENTGDWFLTVEKMMLGTENNGIYDLVPINNGMFFDILPDGTINDNPDIGSLQEMGGTKYDPAYFKNVQNDGQQTLPATHVRSVVFSWYELVQLYDDNKKIDIFSPLLRNVNHLKICFCSITSDHAGVNNSPTRWPHTLVLFMKYGNDYLLAPSNTVITTSFRNRGANYDTLCPPMTSQYIWPPELG